MVAAAVVAASCGGDDNAPVGFAALTTLATEDVAESGTDEGLEQIFDEESPDEEGSESGTDENTGLGEIETPVAAPEVTDVCAAATPADTDIGVTATEIVVVVAADVNVAAAPGLFQGAFDGAEAWAEHVNATGGLACRQVRVVLHDTLLNPGEALNAQLQACENALAMVGTTALFVFDTTEINTCEDGQGNAIGLPDIAQLSTEVAHQCSANTYHIVAPQGACPVEEGGERLYGERIGHVRWYLDNIDPDLLGVFLIPGDLPSTKSAGVTTVRAIQSVGVQVAGEFSVHATSLQPTYVQYIQSIESNGANYARTGSDLNSLVKFRAEAVAQGVEVEIWECAFVCYDQTIFEIGGGVEDGTYIPILHIPFEEADANEEMQAFLDFMEGDVSGVAAFAWAAGVLLEDAVNTVIADTGDINAVTRRSVLDALDTIDAFDAHGMIGATDPVDGIGNTCYVLLQIQGQEFVRIHPTEPGTLDCDASNRAELVLDDSDFTEAFLQ